MIKFIKNLFGFGSADAYTPKETVREATSPKPANKKRRPYRGNKVKPALVTEGKTKGSNNTVKPAQVAKVKSQTPAPKKK
jgi:hypothetical protein